MVEKLKPINNYKKGTDELFGFLKPKEPLLRTRNETLAVVFVVIGLLVVVAGIAGITEILSPPPEPLNWQYTDIFGIPIATPIPTVFLVMLGLGFAIHGPALVKR